MSTGAHIAAMALQNAGIKSKSGPFKGAPKVSDLKREGDGKSNAQNEMFMMQNNMRNNQMDLESFVTDMN